MTTALSSGVSPLLPALWSADTVFCRSPAHYPVERPKVKQLPASDTPSCPVGEARFAQYFLDTAPAL